jgi:hypothetical protein
MVAHNALTRALRHAEANRHVVHNVARWSTPRTASPADRPSKALTAGGGICTDQPTAADILPAFYEAFCRASQVEVISPGVG